MKFFGFSLLNVRICSLCLFWLDIFGLLVKQHQTCEDGLWETGMDVSH